MTVGEQRRFWIPETLAYKGQAGRPAGMLVFDVELLEMVPSPTVPPPDVAAPPADAKKTTSGIAYKVLKPGTGTAHPSRSSRVTVHYSGWQTTGKMFDSSVMRGQPATFALGDVIPGWTEGVQLMVVGEKTRFWIPQELAYKGQSWLARRHARLRRGTAQYPRLSRPPPRSPPIAATRRTGWIMRCCVAPTSTACRDRASSGWWPTAASW